MHNVYEEYAIHWVPRQGNALARFGAGWTGWCADRGGVESDPEVRELARQQRQTLGSVALHGIHANLVAPFKLERDQSLWLLHDVLDETAARSSAVTLPVMELGIADGKVALVLSKPSSEAVSLMSRLSRAAMPFVSGGNTGSPARTPANFEVPLTDRLEPSAAHQVVTDLRPILSPILCHQQIVNDLALMGNPGGGRPWRLLERFALGVADGARLTQADGMGCAGPHLLTGLDDGASSDHDQSPQPLVA